MSRSSYFWKAQDICFEKYLQILISSAQRPPPIPLSGPWSAWGWGLMNMLFKLNWNRTHLFNIVWNWRMLFSSLPCICAFEISASWAQYTTYSHILFLWGCSTHPDSRNNKAWRLPYLVTATIPPGKTKLNDFVDSQRTTSWKYSNWEMVSQPSPIKWSRWN